MYNPRTWYWLADDGRLFSGQQEAIVSASDPDYIAWIDTKMVPTAWPRDDAGEQTDAALQDVLKPYGKFANLTYYTADARWRKNTGGIVVNGRPFATDALSLSALNSAYIYSQSKTAEIFSWKLPDGTYAQLDKTEITALQGAVSEFGQECYACEADVNTDIAAGTITTREQVDAAFAAVSNIFAGVTVEFKTWQRRKK